MIDLKGMILGMQELGAEFVSVNEFYIFFNIPKGSEIDDDEKLSIAKIAFDKVLKLTLKIRRV